MRPSGNRRPNIVLIMSDDLGYEAIGANGGTSYATPVLDSMAGAGIRFENTHVQPLCTPTRVQLMTGKYNFRNYEEFGYLRNGETTFANLLQDAGYKTMIAGKWQLNGLYSREKRHQDVKKINDFGFDEYCLWQVTMQKKEGGERFWQPLIEQNGKKIKHSKKGQYGPDIFTDYICDFMKSQKEKPFFVYYPMVLVHDPFISTPASDNPKIKGQKAFADMMTYCDKMIGRIRAQTEALGIADNTLILITGDNGTDKDIKSLMSGRLVTGGKAKTTEAGTHVPLLAYWQGKTPAGKAIDDLVDFTDFLPTLLEATGSELSKEDNFDGRSFLPQLKGQSGNKREWIFCHYQPRWNKLHKVSSRWTQTQRYKLYQDGRFFDLHQDVLEENPLNPNSEGLNTIKIKLQAVLDRYENEVPYDKSRDKKGSKRTKRKK